MADSTSNALKRPHSEDDLSAVQKRSRSNNGSPAPQPSASNGAARPDVNKMLADARARAAAVRARLAGSSAANTPPVPAVPLATAPASSATDRIAQLKARVAAATNRSTALAQPKPPPPTPGYTPSVYDEIQRARGGLDVGLHPALMAEAQQDSMGAKGRSMQTKFATTMANRKTDSPAPEKKENQLDLSGPSVDEIKSNPYFDASIGQGAALGKSRKSKQLIFNQKGKYIQQAAALRKQAQLEAMKRRIAESARKAGIAEEMDTEKAFLVEEPPAIEWWDEGLVNGDSYAAIDNSANLKIDTPDSIITNLIQHPILLEPPQEKIAPAPKPMYLTTKEQAKLRRQRRMADLKEQQAKIRLGLEPAPPPKVKIGNMMRVLGEEAVKDPTAVETRVNREIQERKDKHEASNEERKLTKEQKHEKLEEQKEKDAAQGIWVSVYKIDNLASGKNRFKISKNAEQNKLTGVCIMHPKMNVVVVEGGLHSIRFYKRLMMQRIHWTDNEAPRADEEGNREVLAEWLEAEDKSGELKDLSLNTCQLVFEGEQKKRAFRKWLGARVCETDSQAKDILARAKMESFWNVARGMKQEV